MTNSSEIRALLNDAEFFAAKESSDSETRVGAIAKIAHKDSKLSHIRAANTFVTGAKNIGLPSIRPDKYKYMIHAEQNLVFSAARNGVSLAGAVVVCTLSPCQNCIRSLWQSGVTEIWFRDLYHAHESTMDDISIITDKIDGYYRMVLNEKDNLVINTL